MDQKKKYNVSGCDTKGEVQTQNNDPEIPMAFFTELKENHKSHREVKRMDSKAVLTTYR